MAGQGGGPPVVGVDLGGTKVLAGVVGHGHEILGRAKRATPAKDGAEAILHAVKDCVHDALEDAGVPRAEVAGIGVGTPGPLDTARGIILFSANMNVRDFALGPDLSRLVGKPVLVRNDVTVGGYGEFRLGAGRGYREVLAAFVGTGIGGCLILDAHIVAGATGNAGEVGHIVVKAGGPKCGCGSRGCMEALASRSAIVRRIEKAVRKGLPTALASKVDRKGVRIKSGDLAEAFEAGDPVAVKEIHRAAKYLGLGLGSLINVFGPQVVIVGGGVSEALGEPYLEAVRASARRQILVDPHETIPIVRGALGDDAGILGASLLAREAFVAA